MKVKLDCEGVLILKVESEIEHYALDCWLRDNIGEQTRPDGERVDVELTAPYLEQDE